jgi:hypothetical protein
MEIDFSMRLGNKEFPPSAALTRHSKLLSVAVFAMIMLTVVSFHLAFALSEAQPSECGIFEYNEHCGLSPIAHLIYGDVIIAGGLSTFLALLFHHFTHKNMLKIDAVIKRVDGIIQSNEEMRIRRKDYSVQHLKNLFQSLLFTTSIIRRSCSNYNLTLTLRTDPEKQQWLRSTSLSKLQSDQAVMARILQNIRNVLVAESDVLETEVISQAEGVCTYLTAISVEQKTDGMMQFQKYEVCRMKIQYLMEQLQTYSVETHAFAEIMTKFTPMERIKMSRSEVEPAMKGMNS